jgi:hypothetical protein
MVLIFHSVNIRTEQKGGRYVKSWDASDQGRLQVFVCNFDKPNSRSCLFATGSGGNQSTSQNAEVDPAHKALSGPGHSKNNKDLGNLRGLCLIRYSIQLPLHTASRDFFPHIPGFHSSLFV